VQTVNLDSSAYGRYELKIRGEANYQEEIRGIIAYEEGSTQSIQEEGLTARLIFEDDNPHDKGNAVRIEIDRRTVGYLSRDDARKYRQALASKNLSGAVGTCYAAIIGKYNDELDDILFGVRLDLTLDNLVVPASSVKQTNPTTISQPKKRTIPFIPMNGKGCLYFLFILPIILIINFYILLFAGLWQLGKSLWTIGNASPRNRKISLGVIGTMSVMAVISNFIGGSGDPVPPTPTMDLVAVQLTALAEAWLPYTQTAQAAVTNTPPPTATLVPTETATLAPLPTATLQVFATATTFLQILPINQSPTSPPAGQSAVCSCAGDTYNCGDFGGSWSAAQACYTYCVSQGAGDIHRLDGNNDGSACDSLK
jgi:hypothetical protein